jgi:hypothetical protein
MCVLRQEAKQNETQNDFYQSKMENKFDSLISTLITYSEENWETIFQNNSLTLSSTPQNHKLCVKLITRIPYSIPEILTVLFDDGFRKTAEDNVAIVPPVDWFSPHSAFAYIRIKPKWKWCLARDFATVLHWKVLDNGDFVRIMFSDQCNDIYPLRPDTVRGNLRLRGSVLRHVEGGTLIFEVIDVSTHVLFT